MSTFGGDHTMSAEDDSRHLKERFRTFLREYHENNYEYKYRDQLRDHFNLGEYWIDISLEDLDSFDEVLSDKLKKNPTKLMDLFEVAATEVADEVTRPRKEGFETVPDIQVMIHSVSIATGLRDLRSDLVSKLVTVSGIIVNASQVKAKATSITLQCTGCRDTVANIQIKRGLDGYNLPRKCPNRDDSAGTRVNRCPLDPYYIMPEKSKCIDFQTLKLQELPEDIPQGGMPRHLKLYCDRYLCDKFVPGNRVTLFGTFAIIKVGKSSSQNSTGAEANVKVGLRSSYLQVIGYKIDTMGPGHTSTIPYTPDEEEEFRILSSSKDAYKKITSSIAPSIFGFDDVKKAVACLLFAGSMKLLPDGTRRRGDINVLLLGDPGTAKSQILKFVEQVAPIGVYTSGKGSSAAGLTASVIRDASNRSFAIEGGAMVLADGGVVCIDEFDKMREDDRVAIHEAMEQQTISIAKAGITVTLNSRCAVLAAANSVHGRWDDYRSDEDNIDFMPTILSRFDMIFVIKDKQDYASDILKAKHVFGVHIGADSNSTDQSSELSLDFLKKYIAFCRSKVGPRVSEAAGKKLVDKYVEMRNGPPPTEGITQEEQDEQKKHEKKSVIPITVRQLEATIRISEALAKLELKPFANEKHIEEALRLFKESTLKAAHSGQLTGAEGFTTDKERETMNTIEKLIKRRLSYGLLINEDALVSEFVNKRHDVRLIKLVLMQLIKTNVLTRKGAPRGKLVCCQK